jgi:hypothetical protein
MTSAVDAYREMICQEKEVTDKILDPGPLQSIADICPKCYGPHVPGKRDDKPDYIICMDGDFQH